MINDSRQAQELSPADLIFLQIYNRTVRPAANAATNDANIANADDSHKSLLFLQSNPNREHSGCIPYIVHITHLNDELDFVILIELGSLAMASSIFDVFFAVHKLRILQMQNDIGNLKQPFENLEHYVKLGIDAHKKTKYNSVVDAAMKHFTAKWTLLRSKYVEFFKHNDQTSILHIESNMPIFIEALKELYHVSCHAAGVKHHIIEQFLFFVQVAFMECNVPNFSLDNLPDHSDVLAENLSLIDGNVCEQASYNIVKSIYKEINGLVHFAHVNRSNGRALVPRIDTTHRNGTIIKQQVTYEYKVFVYYMQLRCR